MTTLTAGCDVRGQGCSATLWVSLALTIREGTLPQTVPPERIESERLVIRCWHPDDASLFKAALDESLPELQRWIPWAMKEPSKLDVLEDRLSGYRDDFFAGRNALFALMDPDETEVLGGAGLYRRVGPGALEIGYWVRSDQAGQGLATEVARVMTDVGFMLAGIERLEIHCDPHNGPSAAVPRKLGYEHSETLVDHVVGPSGESRDTMIWRLTAERYGAPT